MASSKTPAYSTLETENNEPEAQAFEVIGLQSVQVKAPSDLPGGYHLCVEINGTKTLVSVVHTEYVETLSRLNIILLKHLEISAFLIACTRGLYRFVLRYGWIMSA
jgi:hypothetical protein